MGRRGSMVAKYINIKGTPQIVKHTFAEVVQKGVKQNEKMDAVTFDDDIMYISCGLYADKIE